MRQQQTFCMVNQTIVFSFMGQVAESMTAMAQSFHLLVDTRCLSLAGPAVALLEVFFSPDYVRVMGPFLCFIIVC